MANKQVNKILKSTAIILKLLNPPHILKYAYFLLLRRRKIPVRTVLKTSGVKIDLNLGSFIDYWIFMDDSYEKDWLGNIENFVKGKVFIDIGANIGIYSLTLYKKAKFIYAFEPERENYNHLVHNIKINSIKNIKPIKRAVSNLDDQLVPLYLSEVNEGLHSLLIINSKKVQRVKTTTLDYFVSKNKIKNIGLIKIDVEGAELDVLMGSLKIMKKLSPTILIEFNKPRSTLAGHKLLDIYKLMVTNYYHALRMKRGYLVQLKSFQVSKIYNENILFIKRTTALNEK